MTNTQQKQKWMEINRLLISANDKLEELYEKHKAHCINNNGEGLKPGYTLADL